MRICLVSAPIGTEFNDPAEFNNETIRLQSNTPQLGVLTLPAIAERLGYEVKIVDLNRVFFSFVDKGADPMVEDFASSAARLIVDTDSEVYGFSSLCNGYPLTLRIAKLVKAIQPKSSILIGGPQASVVAEPTLRAFPFVDLILRGEAEESLPMLLSELGGRRRLDRVPGLTYRSVFGVQSNPDAQVIADLDTVPFPAYHITGELNGAKVASLELGRGCPFACTFCSTNDFFRRKYRLRSPNRVLEDMRTIQARYGITHFDLAHDMFTIDKKRVRAFCEHMIAYGKGYSWGCSARTDCVDEEMIELMAAAGCSGIFFGVETGSERMQKIIDKHLDIDHAHQMIDITERAGIRTTISLITGFPEETSDDLEATMKVFMHSARTSRSTPQVGLLAPLANTPIQRQYREKLTLERVSSECSHQGAYQHAEDLHLIQKFPDIFPNFYMVPTPHLDRALLMELREFTVMATSQFRYLLGAADQACGGIMQVFAEWTEHRKRIHPMEAGPELRQYYRTAVFRDSLVEFLCTHPGNSDPKLYVLTEFYQRIYSSTPPNHQAVAEAVELDMADPMDADDIPLRRYASRVVSLDGDLQAAIRAVQTCSPYQSTRLGRRYYLVPESDGDRHPGFEISVYLARALELADGSRTVSCVMACLDDELSIASETMRKVFYKALFEKARGERLMAIYRKTPETSLSQSGGFAMAEYSVLSDAASLQNQLSVQTE